MAKDESKVDGSRVPFCDIITMGKLKNTVKYIVLQCLYMLSLKL